VCRDSTRHHRHWHHDFSHPLWRDHGHAQVMVNFFELLAKDFLKEPEGKDKHQRYARRMNWGEFLHFMSGAAHEDIRPLVKKAFGWPTEWDEQYNKATKDFPGIEYWR
jgi:hypothetical protein